MKLFSILTLLPVLAISKPVDVTFHKDVLPVLQKHCQVCHRPGEAGPMSFMSYTETRPWAKAIGEAVSTKKMPPWYASPEHGKFANDRRLSPAEIETLTTWAKNGAKQGNAKDAPAPAKFASGWSIGQPDLILEMPAAYEIPSEGTIEYQHFVIPTNFKENVWVTAVEVRPSNRSITHHGVAFVRPPGSRWLKDAVPGVAYVPKGNWQQNLTPSEEVFETYVPGAVPHKLQAGQAKLIPAGSDIILQMHYTANGKKEMDRSKVGFVFAKEPPTERVYSMGITNTALRIPAGAAAHPVQAKFTYSIDTKLLAMSPHMHLRGKSMKYTAVYPTGERQVLLEVPNYDFNWQIFYYMEKPLEVPKGTRIEIDATFDNSANNPKNPDATKEVRWGDQSWQEMLVGFVDVLIPVNMNPMDLYMVRRPQPKPAE